MKFGIFLSLIPLIKAKAHSSVVSDTYSSSTENNNDIQVQTIEVSSADQVGITSANDYTATDKYGSSFDTTVLTNNKNNAVGVASVSDETEYSSGTSDEDDQTVDVASASDESEYTSGTSDQDDQTVDAASAYGTEPVTTMSEKCDCTKSVLLMPDFTPADYKPVEYTAIAGSIALVVIFVSHVMYEMVSRRRDNYKLLPAVQKSFNF